MAGFLSLGLLAPASHADQPLVSHFLLAADQSTNFWSGTLQYDVVGGKLVDSSGGIVASNFNTSTNVLSAQNVINVTAWTTNGDGTFANAVSATNAGLITEFLIGGLNGSSDGWLTNAGVTQLGFGLHSSGAIAPGTNGADGVTFAIEKEWFLISFNAPTNFDMLCSSGIEEAFYLSGTNLVEYGNQANRNSSIWFNPGDSYASNSTTANPWPSSGVPVAVAAGSSLNVLVAQIAGTGRGLRSLAVQFGTGLVDVTPPTVTDVSGSTGLGDAVVVTFSEAVNAADATTVSNYSLTNELGNPVSINSASLSLGNVVTLGTGSLNSGTTNNLTVRNVRDIAPSPNTMVATNLDFVVADSTPIITIDWRQGSNPDTTVGPSNLVYSLDSSGNLTGGSGLETFSGVALATDFANLVTVRAFDAITFAYDGVVISNSLPNGTNDYVTRAASGTAFDPTSPIDLVSFNQLGFGLDNNHGLTPDENNTFLYNGPNFLQFDFNAPTNGGLSMKVSFDTQGNLAVYEPGDTEPFEGQNAPGFDKFFGPGESFSVVVYNFNVNDPGNSGNARRVRTLTLEFAVPPPPEVTLAISEAGGTATISWDPVVGTLQSAPVITGPWTNVTTGSPYVTPASESEEYYRVEIP
jgi:hypothetical protein